MNLENGAAARLKGSRGRCPEVLAGEVFSHVRRLRLELGAPELVLLGDVGHQRILCKSQRDTERTD